MGRRLPGNTIVEKLILNRIPDDDCLRWTGAHTPSGYGQICISGAIRPVHRVSFEVFVGPIAPDLEIDHLCKVRDCINPNHLEPVTHAENVLRSDAPTGIYARRTRCSQGHEFTPENTKWRGSIRVCRACKRARHREYMARRRAA